MSDFYQKPGVGKLIDDLLMTRGYLAIAENDFAWSSWESQASALDEIDGLIHALQSGGGIDTLNLRCLFAPTGPIQEVSLSSGWAQVFIELANKFDAILDEYIASNFI